MVRRSQRHCAGQENSLFHFRPQKDRRRNGAARFITNRRRMWRCEDLRRVAFHLSAVPARGNTLSCHRHGRPRLITPRDQAWVTGTGRSPDFRVIALFRLPGRVSASGIVEEGSTVTVAGAVAASSDCSASPCSLFIRLAAEPIPIRKLAMAARRVNRAGERMPRWQ